MTPPLGATLADWLSTDPVATGDLNDDLAVPNRVVADFYAPADSQNDLVRDLENDGWVTECHSSTADANVLVHARQDKIWALDELRQLTAALFAMGGRHGGCYDGWFMEDSC